MSVTSLSPIEEFKAAGRLRLDNAAFERQAQETLNEEIGTNPEAEEFLYMQSQMLLKAGCTRLNIVEKLPAKGGVGRYDRDTKMLNVLPCGKAPLSRTLSHEMTHGIDHLYGCLGEEKVANFNIKTDAHCNSCMNYCDF